MHSKSYTVFQFIPGHLTFAGIERLNQGHWVFIGLYIIDYVLLDSGAVRLRGLLYFQHFFLFLPHLFKTLFLKEFWGLFKKILILCLC